MKLSSGRRASRFRRALQDTRVDRIIRITILIRRSYPYLFYDVSLQSGKLASYKSRKTKVVYSDTRNLVLFSQRWEAFIASHQDYGSSDAAMKYTRTALHEAFMMPQTCQVYTSHVDFKTKQSLMGTLSQKCDQNF